jgi:HAD superfamily hydrolase (TIGR01509 family)
MSGRPSAVLFDFNGVLVDDEPIHFEAFRELLEAAGVKLEFAEYQRYLGYDDRSTFEAIFTSRDARPSEQELRRYVRAKQAAYLRRLGGRAPLFDGARELVLALRAAAVPLAIVSGARREEIKAILEPAGLLSEFGAIVAAADVGRGKPDPEGYRLALARLGLSASNGARGIALEDAPAGIVAARAAGLRCVAIASSCPPQALRAADRVARSLREIDPQELAGGRI